MKGALIDVQPVRENGQRRDSANFLCICDDIWQVITKERLPSRDDKLAYSATTYFIQRFLDAFQGGVFAGISPLLVRIASLSC